MAAQLKILVVDDDSDHADSLADLFDLEGHDVAVAYTGEDAIKAFKEIDFDIAFMDVLMPEMNGVESFLKIKQIRPDAQVIMMTGYSVGQLLTQASDNGAVGVLQKPLDIKTILETLENLESNGIVLVAEADQTLAPSIQKLMSEKGWSCGMLNDAKTALADAESKKFDALILDLGIPLIDGLGIYKSIKAAKINLPTIMISDTGADSAGDLADGTNFEFTGVLTKPFELDDLLAKLPSLANSPRHPRTPLVREDRVETTA